MKIEAGPDRVRDTYSCSKCTCIAGCPQKAYLKYVQKVKAQPADLDLSALLAGRAVHGGQEYDALEKVRGRTPRIEEVHEAAVAVFEDEARKDGVPGDTDGFAASHKRQLEDFEKSGDRALIQPYAGSVEAPFEIELAAEGGPAILEGYVDVVSEDPQGEPCVVDFKATGRALTTKEVGSHWQLAIEQVGAAAKSRTLCNFVHGKRQKPTARLLPASRDTTMPARAIAWVVKVVEEWRAMLKSGVFPRCSPTSFQCSASWCEYFGVCYPKTAPSDKMIVNVKPVGVLPAADWRASLIGRSIQQDGSIKLPERTKR